MRSSSPVVTVAPGQHLTEAETTAGGAGRLPSEPWLFDIPCGAEYCN